MQNLLRAQTYPYAGSSTGPYRGLMRKYSCWDARGPARDIFINEIAGKIKDCLEQCLPESNSFVGFSLFMVGKVPEKTKPTIMIVSDDKVRRKAAFQTVKARGIFKEYPGFELGHCSVAAEFQDLRQLGSNEEPILEYSEESEDDQYSSDGDGPGGELMNLLSAEVCSFECPGYEQATRLYFHTSPRSHSHNLASATCGGLFNFQGEHYALTMAHALRPARHAAVGPKRSEPESDSSNESDDFEITGMDDWDEDDEDTKTLTAITSPGSRTPSELSDSEESLLKRYDSHRSSSVSIQTRIATAPSIIYEDEDIMDILEDDDELPEACEPLGSVVSIDQRVDIAVIKVTGEHETICSTGLEYLLNRCANYDLTDTHITVQTTHHPVIKGRRSGAPFYTRFPGTSNFLELHSVKLSTPVRPGDSGSWAYDDERNLVGFVAAGDPKSGSCLLLPTKLALGSMYSLLKNRASLSTIRPWTDISLPESPSSIPEDVLNEDAMTVASSLPPSIFSQRMDRRTPSTAGYSAITTWAERKSHTPQESVSRDSAESTGNFANRSDFLLDQTAKLRRELERAWEIIQEKDRRLQQFITGDLDFSPDISMKDAMSLSSVDHTGSQFTPTQDTTQTQRQLSPSEPSCSQTTVLSEYSRTESPETPVLSDPSALTRLKALKTELETSNRVIAETRTMWRAQVELNDALTKKNQELKKDMKQIIEAIHESKWPDTKANHERLQGTASRLIYDHSLNDDDDWMPPPTRLKIKKESDQHSTTLKDIPPFSESTQASQESGATLIVPRRPARTQVSPLETKNISSYSYTSQPPSRGARRILTPKSRLNPPLSASRGQGSSLSEIERKIDTVPEEDEDDGSALLGGLEPSS
ncbi:hypothetical protein GQX73_g4602 [Xylaria multiplex]|uniref:Uncharacterized protein n=1 Tax=Xylaria multiplex TaxID=323545 RepID=A0A7C8MRZ7_9PEZI|nr:hypothetical protein GQX73_g4602 [Xylaria multiplex]